MARGPEPAGVALFVIARRSRSTLAVHVATCLLLLAASAAMSAQHRRATDVPTHGAVEGGASVVLSNADGRSPYRGIVRYIGRAQCTGVFVAPFAATVPRDAPAYVLTAGHCVDLRGANEVLVDWPVPANHRVVFNFFADTTSRQFEVRVSRIAYATMKGRDIAVLELAARYDELARSGFDPRPITADLPEPADRVVVVGAPLAAANTSFLRLAACQLDAHARLVLEYLWHWFDFMRLGCQDIRPGSSGSPVISRSTGHLVGLVNTTTNGAPEHTGCLLDHPCEPVAGGVATHAASSYMSPVIGLERCFDLRGRFDPSRLVCPLDDGHQVNAWPSALGTLNPRRDTGLMASPPQRNWNVRIDGRFDRYRYKTVDAAHGDCRDIRGYGETRRAVPQAVIDDPLPSGEGHYFLCVIGARSNAADVAQRIEDATIVAVRIDTTPSALPAQIAVTESPTSWMISFRTIAPEVSWYAYKFGRPSETRCDDPSGYRPAVTSFITLSKANRPYVFCAVPHDSALNPGQPYELLLP